MCGLVVSLHRESYFVCLMLDKNQLGIEKTCAFAIPGNWTLHNKHVMKMVVIVWIRNKLVDPTYSKYMVVDKTLRLRIVRAKII